ncbi:hypothetical protein GF325_05145 [Candidatus Bathyarchaeota archaeon]|nr:hypothetical protein [Candidatus Bathyarchaeota archaeon]
MESTAGKNTRREALDLQTTFNQVRNSVGILVEIMEEVSGKKEKQTEIERDTAIIKKLRSMGSRIAKSFARYWTPDIKAIDEMLVNIYKKIFGSRVTVTQPADKQTTLKNFKGKKIFHVEDSSCPLCKKIRQTNISGCEIELGFVEGLFKVMHDLHPGMDVPLLKAGEVTETKTRGDKRCVHMYMLDRPETMSYSEI